MTIEIKLVQLGDQGILDRVSDGGFDSALDKSFTAAFFVEPQNHLWVAVEGGMVIGFVSAVHYDHPDKPRELWINEVGVAPTHQKRGIARSLLRAALQTARELGCIAAWVLTDEGNSAARSLYRSAGGSEAKGHVQFSFALN